MDPKTAIATKAIDELQEANDALLALARYHKAYEVMVDVWEAMANPHIGVMDIEYSDAREDFDAALAALPPHVKEMLADE